MAKKNVKQLASLNFERLANESQTLLANIRFASVDEPVKTICITSTTVEEGKTSTGVALGMAMAKAGKRTLLVDCDMRRRSLGKVLDVHSQAGLYSVLSGQVPLKQAVCPTNTHDLFFLDCEPNVANPSDLLSTKRFATLLSALRNTFDYVIVDTPPLGLFVDAAVVAAHVDGVVIAVRQRVAKRNAVADALAQLKSANARVLGFVMTFAERQESDYYYYAYYNEENKRVKKGESIDVLPDDSQTSRREFDEGDLASWASSVGVSVSAAQPKQSAPARSRHATHATQKDDPYKPGAFRR